MDKFFVMSLLLDFYGELLSQKQKKIMEYYYYNNYSLGEIAEKINISRQGVHDSIKRSEDMLIEFDGKLELIRKYNDMQELLNCAKKKIDHCLVLADSHKYEKIKEDLSETMEILNKSIKQL